MEAIERLDQREQIRTARLKKLVQLERDINRLVRESHRRSGERHDRRLMEMIKGWSKHRLDPSVEPDHVVDVT
jgi:hypothetical protein